MRRCALFFVAFLFVTFNLVTAPSFAEDVDLSRAVIITHSPQDVIAPQ